MLSQIALRQMIAHLYSEEEYRQFAYDDANDEIVKAPKGNMTIGLGWNIQSVGCPKEIAEFAAMYFINHCDIELDKAISFYHTMDEVRKVVLCDMAYNMGAHGVLEFTGMLGAMAKSDWATASIAMLQSKWARQVGNRAITLSKMMETGQWVS